MHLDGSAARRRAEVAPATPCLDDVAAFAWVEGALTGSELARAEAHVDACDACTSLLAALAGGVAPLEPGDRVGRFEIVARVGQGAMGIVYRARDPVLGRDVALKLLRPGARTDRQARMLAEAQAMAKLAHPNVAAVFDAGRDAAGVYLAMELVEGATLRAWLAAAPRDGAAILDVFMQAGRGLHALHEAGLVHRDVKPENLLVGDDGRVRVTDFGLAAPSEDVRAGLVVGTPAYMAPEQRDAAEATPRSDQYALAVALFEAIRGRRPSVDDPLDAPIPGLPERARAAIARALAPDPNDRFPTVAVMLDALAEPAEAAASAPRVPSRAPWIVAASLAAALVATILAVVVLGRKPPSAAIADLRNVDRCAGDERVEAVWNDARRARIHAAFLATKSSFAEDAAARTTDALDAFATGWSAAYRATCEASSVRHEQSDEALDARMRCLDRRLGAFGALASTLASADAAIVVDATTAALDLPDVASCQRVESLVAADPRPADAAVAARVDAIEGALDPFDVALSSAPLRDVATLDALLLDARATAYRPTIARAALLSARLARRLGSFDVAAKLAEEAELAAEASRADGRLAEARLELLGIAGARGEPQRVLELAERARAAILRVGEPEILAAGLALRIGLAATALGHLDDADREIALARRLTESSRGADSLDASRVLTAEADAARVRGDLDRALRIHRAALAIDEKRLGPDHPSLARHHHNIGGVLRLKGDRAEALASYLVALGLERRAGDDSLAEGLTENSISIALLELGRTAEARGHLERAIAILAPKRHPDLALALLNLAAADAADGRHAEAIAELGRAIERLRADLGPDHVRIGWALVERARSRRARGDVAGARADLEEARRIGQAHADAADGRALVERCASDMRPSANVTGRPPPRGGSSYGSAPSWDGPSP